VFLEVAQNVVQYFMYKGVFSFKIFFLGVYQYFFVSGVACFNRIRQTANKNFPHGEI